MLIKLFLKFRILEIIPIFFSIDDDIDDIIKIESLNEFEVFFLKEKSDDPVICKKCFETYIKENDIKISEKVVVIVNSDIKN